MNYISTRGNSKAVSAAMAIKNGLAEDGGLYMPERIPSLTKEDLKELLTMDYPHRAHKILGMFLTDYDSDRLLAMCQQAYSPQRFGNDCAPVVKAGKLSFLELWHGPTCAFKDMALQLMPLLLSEALKITGETRTAQILVATSGDTGKAALEGFCDVDQIKIMVFYPVDGVSALQKKQMVTQKGDNVCVCAINGNFDDAQTAVKTIFSNREVAQSIQKNSFFSSANSINWGRLVPQVAYYVSAYCDMVNSGEIALGEEINTCVPTGNFGDIFAGYIARCMGIPLAKLICASNTNKILCDFFATGTYDRRREFFTTTSPSMDILISSNLERMLYLVCGAKKTAEYMNALKEKGVYSVSREELARLQEIYRGEWCNESETGETLRNLFETEHYLCDTHTSVAVACAKKYLADTEDDKPMLVVSTASPYKFVNSVCRALGLQVSDANEFDSIELLMKHTQTQVPPSLARLKDLTPRFTECVEKEDILNRVLRFVNC